MTSAKPDLRGQWKSLFFGGLLPILAFTYVEDNYGPLWGTVAGMVFGCGEILYEKFKLKEVSKITIGSNLMIFILGAISILTQDGIWFKLQPAILEAVFCFLIWGSLLMKKNVLLLIMEKQNGSVPENLKLFFNGISWRMGFFFFVHAILATWAAIHWSTAAWAMLKGVGLTVSMVLLLVGEAFYLRWKIKRGPQGPL